MMTNARAALVWFSLVTAAAAQEPPPTDVLRGTVQDEKGAPVAGLTLEVRRRDAQGFVCLDLPFSRRTRLVQKVRTGKNGSFAAQLPRGVPFELHLDDGSHAPIRRRVVYAGEEIPLQLGPAARVELFVHDADGKPWPGGTLEAWDTQHVRWIDAPIDAEGRWKSDRLPPGKMTFDLAPGAAQRPQWQTLELEPGATTPLDLVLAKGQVLSGRIIDAATKKPLAGARIGEGWTMDKFVLSDADGRYEMRGYGSSGYGEVRVTADGYGPALKQIPKDRDSVTDFALKPGVELTGRVVDGAGKPVAGAYVAAVGGCFGGGDDTHDWCSATTDAEGRYRVRGLRGRVAHVLMVRADGFASLLGDVPTAGESQTLPDVVMRAPRYVSGVVVDEQGLPVAGADISLRGHNPDRAKLLGASGPVPNRDGDYCTAVRGMKTDSLGRIHFADVPPGTYRLTLELRTGGQELLLEVVADKDPEPVRMTQ